MSIWYQFLQSKIKKRALFPKKTLFINFLKRRGWCGCLYSLPIVSSSPLTLVQCQESPTRTHTLATTLWWLAYKYRSKSFYLYSLYFFQIFFMSINKRQLSQLHFFILISNWYENDIKNLVSYHSHQTLIKIFWHHFDREFF
jgi:hypothetical protein